MAEYSDTVMHECMCLSAAVGVVNIPCWYTSANLLTHLSMSLCLPVA